MTGYFIVDSSDFNEEFSLTSNSHERHDLAPSVETTFLLADIFKNNY
jgi:phosphopantetheine adenylyltransferase